MIAADIIYREAIECLFTGRRQQAGLSLAQLPIWRRKDVSTPPIPKEIIVCLPQKMSTTTTATDAAKKKAGGRKAGTGNYTREELTHLLDILERRLPIKNSKVLRTLDGSIFKVSANEAATKWDHPQHIWKPCCSSKALKELVEILDYEFLHGR